MSNKLKDVSQFNTQYSQLIAFDNHLKKLIEDINNYSNQLENTKKDMSTPLKQKLNQINLKIESLEQQFFSNKKLDFNKEVNDLIVEKNKIEKQIKKINNQNNIQKQDILNKLTPQLKKCYDEKVKLFKYDLECYQYSNFLQINDYELELFGLNKNSKWLFELAAKDGFDEDENNPDSNYIRFIDILRWIFYKEKSFCELSLKSGAYYITDTKLPNSKFSSLDIYKNNLEKHFGKLKIITITTKRQKEVYMEDCEDSHSYLYKVLENIKYDLLVPTNLADFIKYTAEKANEEQLEKILKQDNVFLIKEYTENSGQNYHITEMLSFDNNLIKEPFCKQNSNEKIYNAISDTIKQIYQIEKHNDYLNQVNQIDKNIAEYQNKIKKYKDLLQKETEKANKLKSKNNELELI